MIKRLMALVVIIVSFNTVWVYAQETDTYVDKQIDMFNIDEFDKETQKIINNSGNELLDGFTVKGMVNKLKSGEMGFSFKEVTSYIVKIIFSEIYQQFYLIQRLLVIAVLCAILKNLNSSFSSKSVGELSFYVCYIVLIFIVMSSFHVGAELVMEIAESMVSIMQAILPVLTALMLASGNVSEMAMIGPIIVAVAQWAAVIIKNILIPAITMVTLLEMVNNITSKNILSNMSDLLKALIGWGLKGTAIGFMGFVSVMKLGGSGVSRLAGKTVKIAVSAVPVVGEVMTGAVETAASLTGFVKNSFALGAIVLILLVCMIPIIKLAVMILIFKLTAAVIEPISEPRLVKCISAAGDYSVLLLGSLFVVEIMFVFTLIILLSTA